MIYGALEAGGTKMVCAIGSEDGKVLDQISIPTSTPEKTMPSVIEYFKDKNIAALGIACFGPVDLDKSSPFITTVLKDLLPDLRSKRDGGFRHQNCQTEKRYGSLRASISRRHW